MVERPFCILKWFISTDCHVGQHGGVAGHFQSVSKVIWKGIEAWPCRLDENGPWVRATSGERVTSCSDRGRANEANGYRVSALDGGDRSNDVTL